MSGRTVLVSTGKDSQTAPLSTLAVRNQLIAAVPDFRTVLNALQLPNQPVTNPNAWDATWALRRCSPTRITSMAYNVGWHSLKFGGLFFRGHQGRASIENPNFNYSTLNDALSNTPAQTSFPFGRPAYQGTYHRARRTSRPRLSISTTSRWRPVNDPVNGDPINFWARFGFA